MQRLRVEVPAVIALGGNLGDREATLREAVRRIDRIDDVRVTAASSIVESPALTLHGIDETAPSYLNAVVTVRTVLPPERLLEELQAIEDALGRVRAEQWGDRTVDLDLITAASRVVDSEVLVLPHPRAHERAFVLVPWLEIEPAAVLPGRGPVSALVSRVSDVVRPYHAEPLLPEGPR